MLELINISKSYPSPGSGEDLCVLKNINLKVEKGQSLAVVGPSGSGKSTLLNIIGTLDKPDLGKVLLDGNDLVQQDDTTLAMIRNQQIGLVFQLHHLLAQCTVLENVLIPTLAAKGKSDKKQAEARAMQLLERVGLKNWIYHRPGELSGGQLQRAAVVRALINSPKLLLADEPTGSLDRDSAENIAKLLIELNESENTALIVVTHSMVLAEKMSKVYTLTGGGLNDGVN